MRYPRNAKIFRGQIDAAPFAGLFFLLLAFLLLHATSVFIPGVRVRLDSLEAPQEIKELSLKISGLGEIFYRGEKHDLTTFEAALREEARVGKLPRRVLFDSDPRAEQLIEKRVKAIALELGIALRPPLQRLELPEIGGLPGMPGPTVVVGMNLNGQLFFQHQTINKEQLLEKLKELSGKTKFLTVVLQADKGADHEDIMSICRLAQEAGVNDVLLAARPVRTTSK